MHASVPPRRLSSLPANAAQCLVLLWQSVVCLNICYIFYMYFLQWITAGSCRRGGVATKHSVAIRHVLGHSNAAHTPALFHVTRVCTRSIIIYLLFLNAMFLIRRVSAMCVDQPAAVSVRVRGQAAAVHATCVALPRHMREKTCLREPHVRAGA